VLIFGAGCAVVPDDLGRGDVTALVAQRGVDPDALGQSGVALDSSVPLGVDTAVAAALSNNPELRAQFARLGFSAADIYQANRISNPLFSASRLNSERSGDGHQLSLGLVTSLTDMITRPTRVRLAIADFERLKKDVGDAVMTTLASTLAAYYEYVAAEQIVDLRHQTAKAAQLSFKLAARFEQAGNITARELALAEADAVAAEIVRVESQQTAFEHRRQLSAQMGVSVAGNWRVPRQLPLPQQQDDDLQAMLALAQASRLDLAVGEARVDLLAQQRGFDNWRRWLVDLNIGVERERETDGAYLSGPTIELALPVFSQNRDLVLRLDSELEQALAELDALRLAVVNDVHVAFVATGHAWERVELYRTRLLPALQIATARAQEEQNFMLIGVFELLASKQEEYDHYQSYIEALKDYWLARTALGRAVGNTLPEAGT
jgi:cobalt-zinc-cadmium efflux system outer membrane protein